MFSQNNSGPAQKPATAFTVTHQELAANSGRAVKLNGWLRENRKSALLLIVTDPETSTTEGFPIAGSYTVEYKPAHWELIKMPAFVEDFLRSFHLGRAHFDFAMREWRQESYMVTGDWIKFELSDGAFVGRIVGVASTLNAAFSHHGLMADRVKNLEERLRQGFMDTRHFMRELSRIMDV